MFQADAAVGTGLALTKLYKTYIQCLLGLIPKYLCLLSYPFWHAEMRFEEPMFENGYFPTTGANDVNLSIRVVFLKLQVVGHQCDAVTYTRMGLKS